MQNLEPTHYSGVADYPSAISDVLDRVVTIAPAQLLPTRNKATTLRLHWGSSKPQSPGTRLKNF
jgi:hypothetical protein